ncbi:MAG: hypothetical protein ABIQ27_04800 [Flavobacterium sp.]|uniref:hypothetical protein n=1 Tax=Flavobacterium sp. TaxID=239 RepID=UPI00326665EF
MKKLLYLAAIVLMSFSTFQNEPIERIGLKGPIEFNKTEFKLAWSEKPNANYFVQEYLPKNETVEKFNQLITVNVFVMDVSVENAIQQKEAQLTKRKETDKVCNYSLISSPDGKESILDCILSTEKNGELDVVEFIIYRYKQIELENHKKALLVYSYSKRSYGEDITKFFKNLSQERENLLNTMIAKEMPEIKIKE